MNRSNSTLLAMLVAWALVLPFNGAPASAALLTWGGGSSGTFHDPDNWGENVPGPEDSVLFFNLTSPPPAVTVSFTQNASTLSLDLGNANVTFNMGGHTYDVAAALNMGDAQFTVNNGTLSVGAANVSNGSFFTIGSDATFNTNSALIATGSGSNAEVTVAGILNSSTNIIVANSGTAALTIGDGGSVTTGAITVAGASGGEGTINIGEDALLQTNIATIAAASGSTGTVNIGEGGTWKNNNILTVGALSGTGGNGAINIDEGGLLHTQNLSIGNNGVATQASTGALLLGAADLNIANLSQAQQDLINDGGLFVGTNGLTITNGGLLEATRAFIDAFAANITATATVTGANSLLDLDGGELVVGNIRSGALTVVNGGRVESGEAVIGQAQGSTGTVTVTGQAGGNASQWNIDGSLTVGENGTGTLNVQSGALVTATESAAIGAGESATGTVNVSGTDSTFDIGGDLTLGHSLLDPGAAPQSALNAFLNVTSNGAVIVNNGAGTVIIDQTGRLAGNGTIDGSVDLFGHLSPGAPTGKLTITGDLETHPGSVINIQYNDTPADIEALFPNLNPALVEDLLTSGVIVVEGTATLDDGTVLHLAKIAGGASPGDTIIVLHAEGGGLDPNNLPDLQFQGTFLVDWMSEVIVDNGEQYLKLTAAFNQPGFDDLVDGLTGNLLRVATAIGEGELFDLFAGIDPDNPEAGLRTYLPLQHGSAAVHSVRSSHLLNNSFLGEMAAHRAGFSDLAFNNRGGSSAMIAAANHSHEALAKVVESLDRKTTPQGEADSIAFGALPNPRRETDPWGGFLGGFGIWDSVDSGTDRIGHRARIAGGHGGIHYHFTPDFLLGVSGGYLNTDLNFRNDFGEGEIHTFRFGPYFSWTPGSADGVTGPLDGTFFLDVAATYGFHRNEIDRNTANGVARGRYNAHDISVLGLAGYDIPIVERTIITPMLGAEYTHLRTDSFRESGAGAANLDVDSQSVNSLRGRAGLKLAHAFELNDHIIVPELFAGYAYEFLDTDIDIRSRFIAGGPSFTTRAAGVGRDALQFGAGFTAMHGTGITLFFRYEGEFQSNRTSHAIIGGLNFNY